MECDIAHRVNYRQLDVILIKNDPIQLQLFFIGLFKGVMCSVLFFCSFFLVMSKSVDRNFTSHFLSN